MAADVILVPGFGGSAAQPLLQRLVKAFAAQEVQAVAVTLKKRRPGPDLKEETLELVELWNTHTAGKGAIVGRSFGARVAVRVALQHQVTRLALLGYPIRPPGKRRVGDEKALQQIACPALILQGEDDELGAPDVLREFIAPHVQLEVIPQTKHSYKAAAERQVIQRCVEWLAHSIGSK